MFCVTSHTHYISAEMSEVLDFDNGSESISDIIYESNMTEMELHAEDVGRYVKYS